MKPMGEKGSEDQSLGQSNVALRGIIRSAIPGKCSEGFPLFQHLEPLLLPLLGHSDCFQIHSLWVLPIRNSGHSVLHSLCSTISPSPLHQTGTLTSSATKLSDPRTFSNLLLQHQFPSVVLYLESFPSHPSSSKARVICLLLTK